MGDRGKNGAKKRILKRAPILNELKFQQSKQSRSITNLFGSQKFRAIIEGKYVKVFRPINLVRLLPEMPVTCPESYSSF